jgi:hypothetical protein
MAESRRGKLLTKLRNTDEGNDVDALIEVYEELAPFSGSFSGDAAVAWDEASTAAEMVQRKSSKSWKAYAYEVYNKLYTVLMNITDDVFVPGPPIPPVPAPPSQGGKRSAISTKFDRCVKSVRKSVKARKGSSKESAAIAICTTSVLHPRKRTIKKYRKGRLTTQRRKAL